MRMSNTIQLSQLIIYYVLEAKLVQAYSAGIMISKEFHAKYTNLTDVINKLNFDFVSELFSKSVLSNSYVEFT